MMRQRWTHSPAARVAINFAIYFKSLAQRTDSDWQLLSGSIDLANTLRLRRPMGLVQRALKAAKEIALEVPQSVLVRADEVIE
jgi:hypothetical protein